MNVEEQVDKFSDVLYRFMEKKRLELHELYKEDDYDKWFDRESKYIRYFLRWLKENKVTPVECEPLKIPTCPCGDPAAQESEFCNECLEEDKGVSWVGIKEDSKKYKDECDKVCEEIGLNYLRLRLPHCSSLQHEQEEFIVIDNPCTGGHVINQLALPMAFLTKCLVLGCIPAIDKSEGKIDN